MLLKNFYLPKWYSGTHLVIKHLSQYAIDSSILTGVSNMEEIYIPRIPIIPLGFEFKLLQFL